MADLKIEISTPIAIVIRAAADIAVAAMGLVQINRQTMSQNIRDQVDGIMIQAYWDARSFPERLGIVPAAGQYPQLAAAKTPA